MSASGDSAGRGREALGRLEGAVEQALLRSRQLAERLKEAEGRAEGLDAVLRRIGTGELEPAELVERMRAVEEENRELRLRLERGREGVERLLARIRFLEEQR